jgi:hypothetical protein
MLQEELAGERVTTFPVHGLREELHPSVPAQYPPRSGNGNYLKRPADEQCFGSGIRCLFDPGIRNRIQCVGVIFVFGISGVWE